MAEHIKKNKKEKKQRNKNYRALKNGGYSMLLSVVVIAVVIVINLIAGQLPSKYTEFDISTGQIYTIGYKTQGVLDKLNEDITIYLIAQSGNEDSNIEKLLEQYEENSSHIKVEKKDPVVYPNFTSQYTEDSVSDNTLIIVGSKRNKIISSSEIYETEIDYSTYQSSTTGFDGEGQITSALAFVTSDELPVVYYVEGHSEIEIPEALTNRIEKANLELKALSLLTEDVPEDAVAILLNSPENDYSKAEAEKVINYLKNGGKAMIITDYIGVDMPNYQSILKEYGIEVVDGLLVEGDSNQYVQMPYFIVPEIEYSEITRDMTDGEQYVVFSAAQGFRVAEEVRDTLDVSPILSSSDASFVKMNPEEMTSYEKEEGDVDGPFTMGAMITESISAADTEETEDTEESEDEESAQTKILCFVSSSVLDDSINSMVSDGNYTLYMNGLNWLADTNDEEIVSIASKSIVPEYLTVTTGKALMVTVIVCFALPVLCLIVGGVVCYRRKRR